MMKIVKTIETTTGTIRIMEHYFYKFAFEITDYLNTYTILIMGDKYLYSDIKKVFAVTINKEVMFTYRW